MAAQDDKSAPEPTLEDLSRQIEALRADLNGIAETLKGLGLATGKAAAEGVKARAGAARAAGEEQIAEMHARLETMLAEADRLARDRPITAMGIAAGFGFLVGLMLGRR